MGNTSEIIHFTADQSPDAIPKLIKAFNEEGEERANEMLASMRDFAHFNFEQLLCEAANWRNTYWLSDDETTVLENEQFVLWLCSRLKGDLCPDIAWTIAVRTKSVKMVETLIAAGATVRRGYSTTFLEDCIKQPQTEVRDTIFHLLVGYCRGQKQMLQDALFEALTKGNKKCVKILLQSGVSPNAYSDRLGRKAIHHSYKNVDCLRTLYKAGAKISEEELRLAVHTTGSAALLTLLSFKVVAPNTRLLMEAVVVNNPDVIVALSKAGVSVNTPESHPCWGVDWIPSRASLHPLLVAILLEKGDSAIALLECGAQWSKADKKNSDWAPQALVHLCCSSITQSEKLIQALLKARPDVVGTPALWKFSKTECITPLASAVMLGSVERVLYLLSNGADLNEHTKPVSKTALSQALFWSMPGLNTHRKCRPQESVLVAQFLLDKGAIPRPDERPGLATALEYIEPLQAFMKKQLHWLYALSHHPTCGRNSSLYIIPLPQIDSIWSYLCRPTVPRQRCLGKTCSGL
ncbi:hypothetical protein Pelo_12737 [Pelomyxa schiedti]|nr:hypothetical protein Pelo_12737 [Pelomyxa schiedti]